MPGKSTSLAKAYTKGMARHERGHALFHPVPVEAMKAPCVGYFDDRGKWHLITSLARQYEDPQWSNNEYKPLRKKPQGQPVATESWGILKTSDVYDSAIGFNAGTPDLSAAGIPAQFSVETKWRTASDVGAFLITTPKIIREDFNDGFNAPYKEWIEDNFDTLLTHGKVEMQRFGLWMITETYSTKACMIQTWTDKTREVRVALEANAMMAGQLGPSIERSRTRNCEALSAYVNEDYGGRVVLFCNGLRYRFAHRWQGIKRVPYAQRSHEKKMMDAYERRAHSEVEEKSSSAVDIIHAQNGTEYEMTSGSIGHQSYSEEDDRYFDGDNDSEDKAVDTRLPYRDPSPTISYRQDSDVTCDSCDKHACIKYYHCKTCSDFDLCEECYVDRRKTCDADANHRFDKIWWFNGREVLLT